MIINQVPEIWVATPTKLFLLPRDSAALEHHIAVIEDKADAFQTWRALWIALFFSYAIVLFAILLFFMVSPSAGVFTKIR